MKKSVLFTLVLLLLVSNIAKSQVLEYEWYEYAKVDDPWLQGTDIIWSKMDYDGNLIFLWKYYSSTPLEFCGHYFPIDNYIFSINNDDTFKLVKISPSGQYLWDVNSFAEFAQIACDNDNSIYILSNDERYKVPFVFAGDWVYSYDSTYSTKHRTILKYDENGNEQWAKIFSSSIQFSVGAYWKGFHGGNNYELVYNGWYKGNFYFGDSLIGQADSVLYKYCILNISSNGDINWIRNFHCYNGYTNGTVKKLHNDGSLRTVISVPAQDSLYMDSSFIYFNSSSNTKYLHIHLNINGDILSQNASSNTHITNTHIFTINEDGEYYTITSFSTPYIVYGNDTIFNPSNSLANVVIKLDSNLNYLWSKTYTLFSGSMSGFSLDNQNNLYLLFPNANSFFTDFDTIYSNDGILISVLNSSGETVYNGSISENLGSIYYGYNRGILQANDPENIILSFRLSMFDTVQFFDDTILMNSSPSLPKASTVLFGMHLKYPEYTKQQINFPQGWSLFSTYINPDSLNISNVLAPAADSLELVKDENGLVYWPAFGINMIGNITKGKGYQAYANNSCSVQITGYEILPEITPLELALG